MSICNDQNLKELSDKYGGLMLMRWVDQHQVVLGPDQVVRFVSRFWVIRTIDTPTAPGRILGRGLTPSAAWFDAWRAHQAQA